MSIPRSEKALPSIRQFQIAMVRKRQRPGSGSHPEFLRGRSARVAWPDLSGVLGPIPWCVVGAVATRHYMPERATVDLDVAVAITDAATAEERLRAAGFEPMGRLTIGGSSWRVPGGGVLDLLVLREPWAGEALAAAAGNRDLQGLPIIPLPYLVIMKLDASRHQDVADLARMLGQASEERLSEVRKAVRRWRPDDAEDLEAIIASGRWETGI